MRYRVRWWKDRDSMTSRMFPTIEEAALFTLDKGTGSLITADTRERGAIEEVTLAYVDERGDLRGTREIGKNEMQRIRAVRPVTAG